MKKWKCLWQVRSDANGTKKIQLQISIERKIVKLKGVKLKFFNLYIGWGEEQETIIDLNTDILLDENKKNSK